MFLISALFAEKMVLTASAEEYAYAYGQTVSWAEKNIKINVWDSPSKTKVVAKAELGSSYPLIKKIGNFYKIKVGKKTGWISEIQVQKIYKK